MIIPFEFDFFIDRKNASKNYSLQKNKTMEIVNSHDLECGFLAF